ncbi:ECF transporter S component [Ectobacillus polymachus]|uniref:ECF transporter S component n=1 Tax=Ectobacillus polymachus TaxID=1508806 RepID=UPI003A847097
MRKSSFLAILVSALMILGILAFNSMNDRYYLWISFLFLILIMLPFYIRFERKAFASREVVLLSVLAAIAAVSRVPFSMLPSVQPTSFVIIVSAIVFGGESGFLIGATAAIVSNVFLGQGPWTPWQMVCWGLMGLFAGLLRNTFLMKKVWGRMIYGGIAGFVFGWIMNIWVILGFTDSITWSTVIGVYISSFYFDLAHALSNIFFLGLFSTEWIKILTRFKGKYGMLQESQAAIKLKQ